jgi:DDE superfamily endonuclease
MQIGSVASNLCIVDYSHGMTGSTHDSAAFAHTGAAKYPDCFFDGEEFAWADSTYTVNSRTIPVHKQPALIIYKNALFDGVVSHLHVQSEHCIGVLKGHFQCLCGL